MSASVGSVGVCLRRRAAPRRRFLFLFSNDAEVSPLTHAGASQQHGGVASRHIMHTGSSSRRPGLLWLPLILLQAEEASGGAGVQMVARYFFFFFFFSCSLRNFECLKVACCKFCSWCNLEFAFGNIRIFIDCGSCLSFSSKEGACAFIPVYGVLVRAYR